MSDLDHTEVSDVTNNYRAVNKTDQFQGNLELSAFVVADKTDNYVGSIF